MFLACGRTDGAPADGWAVHRDWDRPEPGGQLSHRISGKIDIRTRYVVARSDTVDSRTANCCTVGCTARSTARDCLDTGMLAVGSTAGCSGKPADSTAVVDCGNCNRQPLGICSHRWPLVRRD